MHVRGSRLLSALPAVVGVALTAFAQTGSAQAGEREAHGTTRRAEAASPAVVGVKRIEAADGSTDESRVEERTVVAKEPGLFGEVFVVDEGPHRALRFGAPDADDQTMIVRQAPWKSPVEYVSTASAGLSFSKAPREGPREALIIGLGGGAFAHHLARVEPGLHIDAVEIDPVVVRLARRHFALDDVPHLSVHVGDGAAFVRTAKNRWNLILVDAYGSDDMPAQLTHAAFFLALRQRMAREGAVVLNLAVSAQNERKILSRFMPLFSRCVSVRTPKDRNLVVIGTDRAIDLRHARASDVSRRQRAKLPLLPLKFRPCASPEPE